MSERVHLVAYDPGWPGLFREAVAGLRARLGNDLVRRAEHFGSTAVPGMPAKPVIDMMVGIPSFEYAKERAVPALTADGWAYFWRSDRPPGHMMFIRYASPDGPRTHHLHMAPAGHKLWERLAFRDYLIAHPDEARRYADLKRRLVEQHRDDREAYTNAKGSYVKRITEAALMARAGGA